MSIETVWGVRGLHGNIPFELRNIDLFTARDWTKRLNEAEVFVSNPGALRAARAVQKAFIEKLMSQGTREASDRAARLWADVETCDKIYLRELTFS